MGTTLKDAANDDDFIVALMKLAGFKDKVHTKTSTTDTLPDFSTFVTKTELETPDVVKKILGAQEGKKSILVEKLGDFFDDKTANNYKAKYDTENEQTPKEFLSLKGINGEKGATGDKGPVGDKGATGDKGPVGDKGATGDKGTGTGLSTVDLNNKINADDQHFQKEVREVMSKPVFEIPTNENEPLSWDWQIGG